MRLKEREVEKKKQKRCRSDGYRECACCGSCAEDAEDVQQEGQPVEPDGEMKDTEQQSMCKEDPGL